ncbi:hypothetical protein HYH03_010306 [Edaphochlamys debaryana]|uniref:Glutaredoxin domain-containing protein n=1 Tax=Edaphochlamys debaryana TaxID=47281 RepID=A0A835Y2D1_9CHLO|nr:hypothetical protein HYH03_010306 [Edaphochlamys debaryana]|eukprot:KAG2491300.1 hypothetical protein HYH03_010306 [Edaphochlamys debaryana]
MAMLSRRAFTACRVQAASRRVTPVRAMASAADKVKSFVGDSKVAIFSKTYCPYCTRVKGLMTELKVPFQVLELDNMGAEGQELQDALQPVTGRRTVPQVFVGGKFIGGCDDTVALHNAGKLKGELAAVGISI